MLSYPELVRNPLFNRLRLLDEKEYQVPLFSRLELNQLTDFLSSQSNQASPHPEEAPFVQLVEAIPHPYGFKKALFSPFQLILHSNLILGN